MRDFLYNGLDSELRGNPRVDLDELVRKVSLDDCVNAFKRLATQCRTPLSLSITRSDEEHGSSRERREPPIPEGAEITVSIDDPPLMGRLDWFSYGAVVDFKTGDPDPGHQDQLRFYAMLVWVASGELPKELSLFYSRTRQRVTVRVPTVDELRELRRKSHDEIAAIRDNISSTPEARPTEENCPYCQVRQLCNEYWLSARTASLRLNSHTLEHSDVGWCDVELLDLLRPQGALGVTGRVESPGTGEVLVAIDPNRCLPPATGGRRVSARILGARVTREGSEIRVSLGRNSEVFWLE